MHELDWQEPEGWPADASPDRLIGDWHLYQRRGGHRTSTDDVLTAWFACHRFGPAASYLDLGCGVGSVLLMTVHRLRPLRSVGVEAQPQSVSMARRSLSELYDPPQVEIVHSDFRAFDAGEERFALITGSPPYFPIGTGVLPDDPQRRACRFEARGGIEAYCETAARWLAPAGRFYAVFQTAFDARVQEAARAAALHITARVDAHMREDRPGPFLTVYEMGLAPEPLCRVSLSIRRADGELTDAYRAARRELGTER